MNIPIKPDLVIMDGRISFISGGQTLLVDRGSTIW
jgi:hypothetical protein